MAKESRVSDERWRAARRMWERGQHSIKQVADSLGVSKALVMKHKAAEGWQLRIGVAPVPVGGAAQAKGKVTENAEVSGRQTLSVTSYRPDTTVERGPARVVAEVSVPPAAQALQRGAEQSDEVCYPGDMTDPYEREEFARLAIIARQKTINARQVRELEAMRSRLYGAIKNTAEKSGPAQALAANRNMSTLKQLHESELESEVAKVKLCLGEFAGLPAAPHACRIVVHMTPGVRIGEPDVQAVYGPNAVEVINMEGKA